MRAAASRVGRHFPGTAQGDRPKVTSTSSLPPGTGPSLRFRCLFQSNREPSSTLNPCPDNAWFRKKRGEQIGFKKLNHICFHTREEPRALASLSPLQAPLTILGKAGTRSSRNIQTGVPEELCSLHAEINTLEDKPPRGVQGRGGAEGPEHRVRQRHAHPRAHPRTRPPRTRPGR